MPPASAGSGAAWIDLTSRRTGSMTVMRTGVGSFTMSEPVPLGSPYARLAVLSRAVASWLSTTLSTTACRWIVKESLAGSVSTSAMTSPKPNVTASPSVAPPVTVGVVSTVPANVDASTVTVPAT